MTMLPLLLAGILAANTADAVSTHVALHRGAHEVVLAPSPWIDDAVLAGAATFEVVGVRQLWHAHRRKTAATIALVAIGVHIAAARWNLEQTQRGGR